MYDAFITGIGKTAVGEHWERPLRDIALEAIQNAMQDAEVGPDDVEAVVIGNAFGATISGQINLASLIVDYAGLRGVEATRVEAADASGGLALRYGISLLSQVETVLVVGVEKVTDQIGAERVTAMTTMLDAEYESVHGATLPAVAGLLMRRYMYEYGLDLNAFEGFSINAHANGSKNPYAMYRNLIKSGRFAAAPMVAEPVNLFDSAPEADGAAAVILTRNLPRQSHNKVIRVLGSAAATDTLALHSRSDILFLSAVNIAAGRLFEQTNKTPTDVELLELHDSFTVLSALQLEAAGFAERGKGWQLAANGDIQPNGKLPISTFGGLKARGNPYGATGVYQAVEVAQQLRGEGGDNQLPNIPHLGMTLNLSGVGSVAVAHLFESVN
ncbi:MAG: acetyl-CoA acetyltransferase [Phototrophicales bacterium]|nr:MAG: acetyl-CoA acetyltransferase [Phototrophicales bacterium]